MGVRFWLSRNRDIVVACERIELLFGLFVF